MKVRVNWASEVNDINGVRLDTIVEHGDLDVDQTLFEPMKQILEQSKSAKIAFRYLHEWLTTTPALLKRPA
jgi:hypothetical protein